MSIKALIGFDHLEGMSNFGNFLDKGITWTPAASGVVGKITSGWVVTGDATNTSEYITIPIRALADASATKVTLGFRVRTDAFVSGAKMVSVASNDSVVVGVGGLFPDLANVGGVAYVELEFELSTGNCKRWANNVAISDVAMTAAAMAGLSVRLYTKAGTNRQAYRDIYVLDDVGSGLPNTHLGLITLGAITLETAVGVDWTATSGTLLQALSTPGEDPSINRALSPVSKAPLTANFKHAAPSGIALKAIDLSIGGINTGGPSSVNGVKLKNGSNETALPNVTLTSTQAQYSLGVRHTAPDGTAWTTANLDATDIVITPDI